MRLITPYVLKDLHKKMVFIGGPRQVGKTTLAKSILENSKNNGLYLNWDRLSDRKKILDGSWSDDDQFLIFDEIHKYKKWKNLVKGYFDTEKDKHQFLVTGSAKLDLYQKGGDSLLGRYNYWRLHPFSLYDFPVKMNKQDVLKRLLNLGGFPEVFSDNNEREARRWREARLTKIIQEDVRDLSQIQQIDLLELLVDHLKNRVGSTLSLNALSQEINVSPVTVAKWIKLLERMYLIFTVKGYDKKITRAVHKPIKVYFYDNAEIENDEAARFENLVANHLLQKNHFFEDYHGYKMDLFYVKDKNQREVDFLVTQNKKLIDLYEVKLSDTNTSKNLVSFAEKLQVKNAYQVVLNTKDIWKKNNLTIANPVELFKSIGEPD